MIFPIGGLILGSVIFLFSSAQSRRLSFYIFWLVGVICFVMSILTFLTAPPVERITGIISFYSIFSLLGYIGIVAATLMAHAHERTSLFSKVMEERQYRAASEITQLAASNSALLELLNFSLDKIIGLLGLSGGAIHVFHRAKDKLVLGSYMGLTARLARRLETIEFGDTAIGRTAKNKRLLIIRDLRLSQDYEFFGGKQEGFTYMALIPVVSEGENWGVISLFGKGPYQPGSLQVDLLEQFGEQLGAALVLGRQVRNMQAARENLAFLMKTLGQELSDISVAKAGLGSVRGIAMAATRFFGGDRFDMVAHDDGAWRLALSSDSADEGKPLHSGYDFIAGPTAGALDSSQQSPFEEFVAERSYIYASLNAGRNWIFIRLEGRRRPTIDFELLTDTFRIINGLYHKFIEITKTAARIKIDTRRGGEPGRPVRPETLTGIAGDLDRLIAQYGDLKQRPELSELFVWLESIQNTAARDAAAPPGKTPIARPAESEKSDIDNIVKSAVKLASGGNRSFLKIDYDSDGRLPEPGISREQLQRSLLEFIAAAIFNTESNGALKLTARGENRSIIFELQGSALAEPPRSADRPTWLRQINGRLESRRVEIDNGQQIDSWRLYIPIRGEQENAPTDRPLRVLAIDSQDIIRDLLSSMLANLGCQASVVGNVAEAMGLFNGAAESGAPYSIIIADHAPDRIDGLKLARELKSLDPRARIVLLTGWGLTLDPDEVSQEGIDYILHKPFRLEQLAEAIRAVAAISQ